MSSGCLFCKIITETGIRQSSFTKTRLPSHSGDINPQAPAHLLVVPKEHIGVTGGGRAEDTEMLGRLMAAAAEVARRKKLDRGYRVVVNTGAEGGQTVSHLHLHVLGGRTHEMASGVKAVALCVRIG